MSNVVERYMKKQEEDFKKNTVQNRRVSLRQFFEWHYDVTIGFYENGSKENIEEISEDQDRYPSIEVFDKHYQPEHEYKTWMIEDWRVHLSSEDYAARSIQDKLYSVSTFCKYLERRNIGDVMVDISETRAEELGGNKIDKQDDIDRRYITKSEFEDMMDAAGKLRNKLLLKLLYDTGLRASEAVSLTIDQIKREERKIENVVNAKQRKLSGDTDTRTIYYTKEFERLLAKWIDHGGRASYMYTGTDGDEGHLLVTKQQPRMATQRVNEIVKEVAERSGLQEEHDGAVYIDAGGNKRHQFTAHSLRHSFAVSRVKQGLPIVWLQEFLGHAEIDQTRTYLQFREEDKKQAYYKYQP